jgi:CspA family cold shock protein
VKNWNLDRGFGFIAPEDGGPDVFVHVSTLQRAGLDELAVGELVEYETGVDPRTGKTRVSALKMI